MLRPFQKKMTFSINSLKNNIQPPPIVPEPQTVEPEPKPKTKKKIQILNLVKQRKKIRKKSPRRKIEIKNLNRSLRKILKRLKEKQLHKQKVLLHPLIILHHL